MFFASSIEGEPTNVTWFKDNISIDNNPDYQTSKIDNRHILTIEETFVEDSAKFTCRAGNDSGFTETSAYLTVKGNSRRRRDVNPKFLLNNF